MLAVISVEDEVELVREKTRKAREDLRRLGKAYLDIVFDDGEGLTPLAASRGQARSWDA